MEEHVGQIWHRLISRAARHDYPDAAVRLDDVRQSVGVIFRALGGEGGLRVEACTETAHGARRSLAQKLAGLGEQVELAWRDDETLRLPMRIAWFESADLNRDLYLWLAALASVQLPVDDTISCSIKESEPCGRSVWLRRSVYATYQLLKQYPGLRPRYKRLLEAHLAERPSLPSLRADEAAQELIIQQALSSPQDELPQWPEARRAAMPVPMWLHPAPPVMGTVAAGSRVEDEPSPDDQDDEAGEPDKTIATDKRRRGERVDTPDGRDGLLAFRLESMFSRAEYVAVDRSTDEDEDEDSKDALEDLELLSMASGGKKPKARLRFDLDLPSEEHDDIRLGEGITLPEWDFRKQTLVPDQCQLIPMLGKDCLPQPLPRRLHGKSQRMKQVFDLVQARRTWQRGQPDGSEIDTDAVIMKACDRRRGVDNGDLRVFRQLHQNQRDLACLVLADLSMSTDSYVNDEQRVIDVIRDSLLLFSEALATTQDQFALYGFSSRRRDHVRFHTLKTFEERHDETIIGRIMSIKPGFYTRMGAALRYATKLLEATPATQKLLILLTDGKPNDLDRYEGRYGVEDTRQAVLESSRAGVTPFCVTIDDKAQTYLPYLFGQSAYARVKHVNELPSRLPLLYAQLTR